MKQLLWIIGIIAVAFLFGAYLSEDTSPAYRSPSVPGGTPKPPEDIESSTKEMFMSECVGGDATYSYCSCAWTEIRKDYSLLQIGELGQIPEDEMLSYLMPYIRLCLSKLEEN